jgi:hypothetical protein
VHQKFPRKTRILLGTATFFWNILPKNFGQHTHPWENSGGVFLDVSCHPESESAIRIAKFLVYHEISNLLCFFVRDCTRHRHLSWKPHRNYSKSLCATTRRQAKAVRVMHAKDKKKVLDLGVPRSSHVPLNCIPRNVVSDLKTAHVIITFWLVAWQLHWSDITTWNL